MSDITDIELKRGFRLKAGAIVAPLVLPILPAVITLVLMMLAASGPPAAAVILFFGVVSTVLAFLAGLVISAILATRRSRWMGEMRDRIAATGIRADEIHWFRNELKPSEKRALRSIESRDLVLADAFRETLASRLTATRIVRSSKRELQFAKRRQSSLKRLKAPNRDQFLTQIVKDIEKISGINDEARLMLGEAEARLQMIEAAASRGGSLADNELALKKLSARASELPLALEAAKMADEIRKELEETDLTDLENEKDAPQAAS